MHHSCAGPSHFVEEELQGKKYTEVIEIINGKALVAMQDILPC